MRDLIYQVAVGPSSRLYHWCIESVRKYASRLGAVHFVQTEPKLRIRPDPLRSGRSREAVERLGYLPIFEKELAFSHFGKFERIAVIDSDVYIRDSAPCIFDQLADSDFAAVIERESPINQRYRQKLKRYSQGQYGKLGTVDWNWNQDGAAFMNMGVMLMGNDFPEYLDNQSPSEFLARPEFKPFIDGEGSWKWSTDQTLLNFFIRRSGMRVGALDWRFNALFTAVLPERIQEAWFVHFFLREYLPGRGEDVAALAKRIRVPAPTMVDQIRPEQLGVSNHPLSKAAKGGEEH